MHTINKLPKNILILKFIKIILLTITLLSINNSLSLPKPFSQPKIQILIIFLNILLILPTTIIIILQITKHLTPQLINHPPQYSHSKKKKNNNTNH